MAIRYRADRKNAWCVYWNNPITGKRESKSFATEEEAKQENERVLARLKDDRASFSEEAKFVNPTLEEAYIRYLKEKKHHTVNTFKTRHFKIKFALQEIGNVHLNDITKQMLQNLQTKIIDTGVMMTTVRSKMKALYAVLHWAIENELCEPMRFPKSVEAHTQVFIPPTATELSTMYKCGTPMIKRVIVIGSQCGLRVGPSEMLSLKWEDVDLEGKTIKVHGAMKNKQALWRDVPIKESLLPTLRSWKKEDESLGTDYVIHDAEGNNVDNIRYQWYANLEKAGIGRHIRPYDLRHAFATETIAAGADIGTVAKIMGHANANMILQHYQYVMTKQKRAAVENIPDIEGL